MAAASLLSIIRWKRGGLKLSSVCPAAAPASSWTRSCAALRLICAAKWIGKSASRAFNGGRHGVGANRLISGGRLVLAVKSVDSPQVAFHQRFAAKLGDDL